jgi:hypothetical protein
MKTIVFTLFASAISLTAFAQDVTTVNAYSNEISDNLDLRAVASIFGESANLEDFERRLNDPKLQISNLDLNNDNQVDYLRVIESVEANTHLIILQSVLARDIYQDVATVEVEKDIHNNVQVQVVGNVYMYGPNYIYEPVYVQRPGIYTSFWIGGYHPYVSNWYWGYYPTHFYAWNPYPVFRYRRNVNVCINVHNHYNYVNVRRSQRAVALYGGQRSNGYEKQYPTRSFQQRHDQVTNRYELDQKRNIRDVRVASNTTRNSGTRTNASNKNNLVRENSGTRSNESIRTQVNTPNSSGTRTNANIKSNSVRENGGTRSNENIRTQVNTPRPNNRTETASTRENTGIRTQSNVTSNNSGTRAQVNTPRSNTRSEVTTPRLTNNNGLLSQNTAQKVSNSTQKINNQGTTPRATQNTRNETSTRNAGINKQATSQRQTSASRGSESGR